MSRSELQRIIAGQEEKLRKYEQKLKTLVTAYKNLDTEKIALENSLRALTTAGPDTLEEDAPKEADTSENGSVASSSGTADVTCAGKKTPEITGSGAADASLGRQDAQLEKVIATQQQQLTTLKETIGTLTSEQTKLKSSMIAEKRSLTADNKRLELDLEKSQEMAEIKRKDLEAGIVDLRKRVKSEQMEREREQSDHALMLRELQNLLAEERSVKEDLEQRLETSVSAAAHRNTVNITQERNEIRISELQKELAEMHSQLLVAEERSQKPSPLLVQLQKDLSNSRSENQIALRAERRLVVDAQESAARSARLFEERIRSLETKIAELSSLVGEYETMRYQDQMVIHKLRSRIAALDGDGLASPGTVIPPARGSSTSDPTSLPPPSHKTGHQHFDIDTVLNNLGGIHASSLSDSQKSLLVSNLMSLSKSCNIELHQQCIERLKSVREELETLHSQTELKKNSENETLSLEMLVRGKVDVTEVPRVGEAEEREKEELKNRLRQARRSIQQAEADTQRRTHELREEMRQQAIASERRLATERTEMSGKLAELENELSSYRERTLSIIADKDREIADLRSLAFGADEGASTQSAYSPKPQNWEMSEPVTQLGQFPESHDSTGLIQAGLQDQQSRPATSQRLNMNQLLHADARGQQLLLHHAEERTRFQAEISLLRHQKSTLETELRTAKRSADLHEMELADDVATLRMETLRLQRDACRREGANLEYLKNVTLIFLTTRERAVRKQTLKAICTILVLTPQEIGLVEKVQEALW